MSHAVSHIYATRRTNNVRERWKNTVVVRHDGLNFSQPRNELRHRPASVDFIAVFSAIPVWLLFTAVSPLFPELKNAVKSPATGPNSIARRICAEISSIVHDFSIKSEAPSRNACSRAPGPANVVSISTCVSGASTLIGPIASNPFCSPISISSKITSGPLSLVSAVKTSIGDENCRAHLNPPSSSRRLANKDRKAGLSSTSQSRIGADSFAAHTTLVASVCKISSLPFIKNFLSKRESAAAVPLPHVLFRPRKPHLPNNARHRQKLIPQNYGTRTMNNSLCRLLCALGYSLHSTPLFACNISSALASGTCPLN